MTDNGTGTITVKVDSDDIRRLMDTGMTKVRLHDGDIEVYAKCRDSLQFEVVADE